ncbi:LPS-assembly protein LptD [Pseudoruegeria sp. SK021]|uniref:LPS-assembly protein LptD n=1 Tax=Pseudoruegeria sp. SK021 TaxID=1933035 RepID=UPI000A215487|nr:LPS assembly protein LptD [Pseudoruegeria sp. SK021]OSP55420.1 hypothetical protein BV911_07150 [Pseudoruegeria sp. SK021]
MTLPARLLPQVSARRLTASALIVLVCLGLPGRLLAQGTPDPTMMTSLVADVVRIDDGQRLIASGNVEVFSDGRRLRASKLTFDQTTDRLVIDGPIVLQDENGTLILADQAELDTDLNNGILRGARLVLQEQLQIAGAEMSRTDGRFSDLKRVVASSCEVCIAGKAPLWEIRATRVIHDQLDKQIYFYDARFRIAGVPVFYLPMLRVPDGTDPRVTGFLAPIYRQTSELGPGLKLPYFITLGEHADLTLTPYVAPDFGYELTNGYTRTLQGRYRQAFANGDLEINTAVTRDSILPDTTRAYFFGDAEFDIPYDFDLTLTVQTVSDDEYLSDYDFSGEDRLESSIGLFRTQEHERVEGELVYFQSLRSDEVEAEQPTYVADGQWNRRFFMPGVDSWLDVDLIGHAHIRPSEMNIVGRDMAQTRASVTWSEIWTTDAGFRFDTNARVNGDLKYIGNDDRYDTTQVALTPTAALAVGYPMARQSAQGARYLLEPIGQFVWTAKDTLEGPNDDSTLTAFDAGNMFDLNRFPGLDRQEEGGRINAALRWTRYAPDGWSLGLTGGRVFRFEDLGQFPDGTGLAGASSNWLAQADLDFGERLQLRSLTLMDNGFEPTLNETRLSWQSPALELSSTYIWQREDAAFDISDDISEVSFEAAFDLGLRWSAELDLRRDFISDQTNQAGLGLIYTNECVRVDLSALRKFRTDEDDNIEPSTSFDLTVTLAGFGNNDNQARYRRTCTN